MKKIICTVAAIYFSLLNIYGQYERTLGYEIGGYNLVWVYDKNKSDKYVNFPNNGLMVNGTLILPCIFYQINIPSSMGDKYFIQTKIKKDYGNNCHRLYTMDGKIAFPKDYQSYLTDDYNNKFILFKYDNGEKELYTPSFQLLEENVSYVGKLVKYGEKSFLPVRLNNNNNKLYSTDYDLVLNDYSLINEKRFEGRNELFYEVLYKSDIRDLRDSCFNVIISGYTYLSLGNDNFFHAENKSGYLGLLDSNFKWIVPWTKGLRSDKSVYVHWNNNVSEYLLCERDGLWGLYDLKNKNEIMQPEYEAIEHFELTNYFKVKKNGFWGVIALQGNVLKTIIPTSRGYTNIGSYIQSKKHFTYEMDGYKGECNHLGKQVSKIKVATSPQKQIPSTRNPDMDAVDYFAKGSVEEYFKRYSESFKYYLKAAEMGHGTAQYKVGYQYLKGLGIAENKIEATKWFRKSAENGIELGQFFLAMRYLFGDGIEKNSTEAVKWLRKAADQGLPEAQYYLGCCYYDGEGVEKNYDEAVKWLEKAKAQGDEDAQEALIKILVKESKKR